MRPCFLQGRLCFFDRFSTGCRTGYACLDGARPNGAGTAEVCLPDVVTEADGESR